MTANASKPIRFALLAIMWLGSGAPRPLPAQTPDRQPSPDEQRARQQIESAHAAYIRAFGDGDVNEVVALYDTAATELLPHGRVIRGHPDLVQYWGAWIKAVGRIRLSLTSSDFWLLGNRAYEIGKYMTRYTNKAGGADSVGGNYAIEWRRQADGNWKILTPFDTPQ